MIAELKEVKLYYEKSGEGKPMILLHGNGEDHHVFDKFISFASATHTVYAIDTRGHGRSGKAVLGYRMMARDIEEFIELLGLNKPVIIGFSDGGIVALMVAADMGASIGGIAALGANARPDGIKRAWLRLFSLGYLFTHSEYLKLMIKEPDIESDELRKIVCPTLIAAGERDIILREHTEYIASEIKGAELKIIKGATHSSYVKDGKLYNIVIEFFNKKR